MAINMLQEPMKASQYKSDVHSEWCPGCGDFGIVNGIQGALAEMRLPPCFQVLDALEKPLTTLKYTGPTPSTVESCLLH
jgi:pyruvate/2-oxoacid:ferredoxin oxidoreductase beta subunit